MNGNNHGGFFVFGGPPQGPQGPQGFESRAAACEALQTFMKAIETRKEMAVGTYVERNEFGRKRYNIPADNQAAIISAVLPAGIFDPNTGGMADIEIVAVLEPGLYATYLVDSRFYREAGTGRSNVTSFGRR